MTNPLATLSDKILGTDFASEADEERALEAVTRLATGMSGVMTKFATQTMEMLDRVLGVDVSGMVSAVGSQISSITEHVASALPELMSRIGDFISRVFTWEYWFEDTDEERAARRIRDDLKNMRLQQERKARTVSVLRRSAEGSETMSEAVERFNSGDVTRDDLRTLVEDTLRTEGKDENLEKMLSTLAAAREFDRFESMELGEEAARSRGRLIEDMNRAIDTFGFDKDSAEITGAIDEFRLGKLTAESLKGLLRATREGSHDDLARKEAGLALAVFGTYENTIRELNEISKESQRIMQNFNEVDPTGMTESNMQADETELEMRMNGTNNGVGSVNAVSNVVNNRKTTISVQPSARNDDGTFGRGINGTGLAGSAM